MWQGSYCTGKGKLTSDGFTWRRKGNGKRKGKEKLLLKKGFPWLANLRAGEQKRIVDNDIHIVLLLFYWQVSWFLITASPCFGVVHMVVLSSQLDSMKLSDSIFSLNPSTYTNKPCYWVSEFDRVFTQRQQCETSCSILLSSFGLWLF